MAVLRRRQPRKPWLVLTAWTDDDSPIHNVPEVIGERLTSGRLSAYEAHTSPRRRRRGGGPWHRVARRAADRGRPTRQGAGRHRRERPRAPVEHRLPARRPDAGDRTGRTA